MAVRIIWSFWRGPMDAITRRCVESWARHARGWTVRVLDERSLGRYRIRRPAAFAALTPAQQSDVVRLSLLSRYGGLWMDASVLLSAPLDWLPALDGDAYFGFALYPNYVESWLLYCPRPGNPHIGRWLAALNELIDTRPRQRHPAYRAAAACLPHIVPGALREAREYFLVYLAYHHCVETEAAFRAEFARMPARTERALAAMPGARLFYDGFRPLRCFPYVTKFTKHGRNAYRWLRPEMLALYTALAVAVAVAVWRARRRWLRSDRAA